ncbi:unnamed protein product [Effrenium voratum]|uniref:Methyltransferase domain-containing protein n=1 Tax=Effrenium voratum TaxID=2562239 RepID=A0AA36NBD6_9DINO|nr:unnamed protein product [Effrenium voratum]CAJ1396143.1 unnamed protein product [Effrenium voratum]CAJ1436320.1 unnamed protein product [Effrenium voratum]
MACAAPECGASGLSVAKEELAQTYAKEAEGYEKIVDEDLKTKKELYHKVVATFLKGVDAGPVLDVSCGPGHVLERVAAVEPRPLLGSDICQEMLDLASKRLPSATFRRADMTDLTQAFPEAASIAGIMNMFAVHHVDEAGLQSALAEAHRLLKVQGCLMVAFWEGGHGELMEHVPKAWDKAYLWSFDGMKALADKAGFDAVVEFSEKDEDLEMNAGFLYFKKRAEAS